MGKEGETNVHLVPVAIHTPVPSVTIAKHSAASWRTTCRTRDRRPGMRRRAMAPRGEKRAKARHCWDCPSVSQIPTSWPDLGRCPIPSKASWLRCASGVDAGGGGDVRL